MKNLKVAIFAFLTLIAVATAARAHVALDYPVGGETFTEGEVVDIQWHIVIPHDLQNWDLYFSQDGGSTWDVIEMDLPPAQLNYLWTVPGIETTQGRIRIYMDNTGPDYEDQSGDFTITPVPTDVSEFTDNIPSSYSITNNYPNPFNASTTIRYSLPEANDVTIGIFDILGRKVETLVKAEQQPGFHQVVWNAEDASSGMYFYRIQAGDYAETRKMVLLR